MHSILDTYFAPNRTIADIREIVKNGGGVDPLKDFAEVAREEDDKLLQKIINWLKLAA